MPDLKLIAFDSEDLAVISAHLQDAVLKVGDMAYLRREKRFALVANRFDWVAAANGGSHARRFERRRAGLRFERVLAAKITGFELGAKDRCLELLAIQFETAEEPAGHVTLHFAGGGGVLLRVECIEAELKDLGAAWVTYSQPRHPEPKPPSQT